MEQMDKALAGLVSRINSLEAQIEKKLLENQKLFYSAVNSKFIKFEKEFAAMQRSFKVSAWKYVLTSRFLILFTTPVIYSMIIPAVILDISLIVYQHTCFRAYCIPLIKRSDYISFDRAGLPYLNVIQKLNCAYCGYVSGLIAYTREIVARTEEYWCPITHARSVAMPHPRYAGFVAFGDGAGFLAAQERLRKHAQKPTKPHATGHDDNALDDEGERHDLSAHKNALE